MSFGYGLINQTFKRHHLGFWDTGMDFLHYFITFYNQMINWLIERSRTVLKHDHFHQDSCMNPLKLTNMLWIELSRNCKRKWEEIPGSVPLFGSTLKVNGVYVETHLETHDPSNFCANLFSSFWVMLLTNQPTNKQTNIFEFQILTL